MTSTPPPADDPTADAPLTMIYHPDHESDTLIVRSFEPFELHSTADTRPAPRWRRLRWLTLVMLPIVVIGTYYLVSHLTATHVAGSHYPRFHGTDEERLELFLQLMSNDTARDMSYALTRRPSRAGTLGGLLAAVHVREEMQRLRIFDTIVDEQFSVLLSEPHVPPTPTSFLHLYVGDDSRAPVFRAALREDTTADSTAAHSEVVAPFLAYTPSGTLPRGTCYVYVHYGRQEDYALAAKHHQLRGCIALARYGRIFRGLKIMIGERHYGVAGVLIYSDPEDDGAARGEMYPNGPYRPPSGVQRGSAQYLSIYPGDPNTPNSPAPANSELPLPLHQNRSEVLNLPQVPALPLSWADAEPLLAALGVNVSDATTWGWRDDGRATDSTTSAAGTRARARPSLHLAVWNREFRSTITNVIAEVRGREEPEQAVIIGSHHDAWVFGAMDPVSGTVAMLAIARALAELRKRDPDWRPRRTLRFISWDAEEAGLIGSTEHVERLASYLQEHTVAYLNVDSAAAGELLSAGASPSLAPAIRRAYDRVLALNNGSSPPALAWDREVALLGTGSDFTAFAHHIGVPSADIGGDSRVAFGDGIYHSAYDSFDWMNRFGDPRWERHIFVARVLGALAYDLAESPTVPLELGEIPRMLQRSHAEVDARLGARNATQTLHPYFRFAWRSTFPDAIDLFNASVTRCAAGPPASAQRAKVHTMFLVHRALAQRAVAWYRNPFFAPCLYGGYTACVLPGVVDALIVDPPASPDWVDATTHVNEIAQRLRDAAAFLCPGGARPV